jgi:hypothetical protein
MSIIFYAKNPFYLLRKLLLYQNFSENILYNSTKGGFGDAFAKRKQSLYL